MGPGGSAPAGCATCAACCEVHQPDQPSACNTACVPLSLLSANVPPCVPIGATRPRLAARNYPYATLLLLLLEIFAQCCWSPVR